MPLGQSARSPVRASGPRPAHRAPKKWGALFRLTQACMVQTQCLRAQQTARRGIIALMWNEDSRMTGQKRTQFASKALVIAELFAAKFASTQFSATVPLTVRMQEMDVETTDGGKQARTAIMLQQQGHASGGAVLGWVDFGQDLVELRTFAVIDQVNKNRTGQGIGVPRTEYDQFLADARAFFTAQQLRFQELARVPAPVAAEGGAASGGNNTMMLVAIGVVVAAIAGAAAWFLGV